MSIDGYLKEGISVDSQPCFGSLVTISTIDGDIGMIEREFSLLVEKAVNNHDQLQQENAELKKCRDDAISKMSKSWQHNASDYPDIMSEFVVMANGQCEEIAQLKKDKEELRDLMKEMKGELTYFYNHEHFELQDMDIHSENLAKLAKISELLNKND